jgi:hypothetical protein
MIEDLVELIALEQLEAEEAADRDRQSREDWEQ